MYLCYYSVWQLFNLCILTLWKLNCSCKITYEYNVVNVCERAIKWSALCSLKLKNNVIGCLLHRLVHWSHVRYSCSSVTLLEVKTHWNNMGRETFHISHIPISINELFKKVSCQANHNHPSSVVEEGIRSFTQVKVTPQFRK